MSVLLPTLSSKQEVDSVILNTEDLLLVLRFGRASDITCMQQDDILAKTAEQLRKMAVIYCVSVDEVPVYVQYFDITLIPATIFFFNGQHMKVDWGTPDHTKFIGNFKTKQDFIDVVEVLYRGAMKGKVMVTSPLDPRDVPKYELIYKNI
ncbi:thioredoxin-like protein 4B [Lingula anatina]|uniref:Thioredoxin-like protein n=1 Tax=Lingula anatina TaxID=7574 RepID=A0A1S3JYK7_LINAN|nr:thioredoxin-like protein 4B [Lingula anatina]|eukprot:XP_013415111.1 thioredoxin-like protein 4B [Lingula anatina]